GLGISLPSSPGFIGVVQAATVLALSLFGVSRVDALSFSLLLHASQFVPVTVWGLLLLVVEHVSLTDARRVGAAPSMTPPGPTSQVGARLLLGRRDAGASVLDGHPRPGPPFRAFASLALARAHPEPWLRPGSHGQRHFSPRKRSPRAYRPRQ